MSKERIHREEAGKQKQSWRSELGKAEAAIILTMSSNLETSGGLPKIGQ